MPDGVGQLDTEPGIVLGPLVLRARSRQPDPDRLSLGSYDHAPMLAAGIDRLEPSGLEVDPGDQGGIKGQCSLDIGGRGDLAGEGTIFLDESGKQLAQSDLGEVALPAQFIEALHPLALVDLVLLDGCVEEPIEPFQLSDLLLEAGALLGRESLVLAGGKLV